MGAVQADRCMGGYERFGREADLIAVVGSVSAATCISGQQVPGAPVLS